jgi:hypothetical protein
MVGGWRKLHNEELHNLYSSPDMIRMIKSRRMRWAGHVARMGGKRNAYRILVGKPEGKRLLGRPRRRWVSNISHYNRLSTKVFFFSKLYRTQKQNHFARTKGTRVISKKFLQYLQIFGRILKCIKPPHGGPVHHTKFSRNRCNMWKCIKIKHTHILLYR